MKIKSLITLITAVFIPLMAAGQDIQLTAEYPNVVTAGEQFAISFSVNTSGGDFMPPAFNGFTNIMGPQTSYSQSTQVVNGKFTSQTSYTYTYFMTAVKAGKTVNAPAHIKVKGKEYSTDSIRIEVTGPTANNSKAARGNRQAETSGAEQGPAGSDLYIRLLLNRTDVYQGEYIVATLKVYSRVQLTGLNEEKYPDFNGFMKENLDIPPLTSLQRENVNGVIYNTGVVHQFLLFPQVSGELTIGAIDISALIQQKAGNSDPFFGDFFSSYQTVPKTISTKPVTITVKPLPGAKPADFSGIVGKIELTSSMSKDSVSVNDALNFKIQVSGNGNLKLAGKPTLKLSPDVEVYEPKITDNIRNSATGTSGQKIFEYVLIPRHYGSFTVPPVTYTYFDTETRSYKSLSTREYTFYAKKVADQGGGVTVYGGVSKEDIKYLGKDIRFIDSSTGRLGNQVDFLISKKAFLSFYGLAFLIFAAILIIRREHIRRNADITSVKNRKAGKVAGRRLAEASEYLKSGQNDKFHEEILRALWGYLSDKLSIPVSDLTRVTATEALRAKGIEEEKIESLAGILDKCEYARFAPVSADSDTGIYESAMQFIKYVENSI
ncbi:MAG TPA: BatD family protein [Bacteroidales bacterium]|nr:BatD family protein [Bacteroidales bacterium]